MTDKKSRKRHSPEQIIRKLREADAMFPFIGKYHSRASSRDKAPFEAFTLLATV